MCALRWDHPACCSIHKATHYDIDAPARQLLADGSTAAVADGSAADGYEDEEDATSSSWDDGHWKGSEWYCWDRAPLRQQPVNAADCQMQQLILLTARYLASMTLMWLMILVWPVACPGYVMVLI